MGDERIFYRPGEELEIDLAASVILDLSGSMNHQRQNLQDASIVSQVALEKLDVPHEIWGYSGGYGSTAEHFEYKSFGSESARGLGRISNTNDDVAAGGGGTPTSEAANFCTARLQKRQEEHRVMFVFTDGHPNDDEATIQAVQNARQKKLTVLGILFEESDEGYGYGGSSSQEMMKKIFGGEHVVINDMKELPKAVGKKLKKMLKIPS